MKGSKIIKKAIEDIESGEKNYDGIVEDDVFWNALHVAMQYSKASYPFEHSFDEYTEKWFNKIENKYNFIMWLKKLSKAMKKNEEGER